MMKPKSFVEIKEYVKDSQIEIESQKIAQKNFEEKKEIEAQIQNNDKRTLDFIHQTLLYQGDDPFPEKLFERPQKGVTWGLGGELLKVKKSNQLQ